MTAPADNFLAAWFTLELQGAVEPLFFRNISGLGSSNEVVTNKVTDTKGRQVVQKIPGNLTWGDITFSRGTSKSLEVAKWRQMVEEGKIDGARKNGSVKLLGLDGTEVARWEFVRAWPSELNFGDLDASSGDVLLESVTIVHEGIVRKK